MTKCPRCGEPMTGGICDNCGFPLRKSPKMIAMTVHRAGLHAPSQVVVR